ncbi:hypothetical protein SLS58_002918 [Diplodia intermedia]|uniref:Uncharacterized protein n=1 Tax=Diplodia intermedia TaxID=856260 RepID=A0ABR3TY23_9PEZI
MSSASSKLADMPPIRKTLVNRVIFVQRQLEVVKEALDTASDHTLAQSHDTIMTATANLAVQMREDMDALRAEVKNDTRAEIETLRAELVAIRDTVRAELDASRTQTSTNKDETRAEMHTLVDAAKAEIRAEMRTLIDGSEAESQADTTAIETDEQRESVRQDAVDYNNQARLANKRPFWFGGEFTPLHSLEDNEEIPNFPADTHAVGSLTRDELDGLLASLEVVVPSSTSVENTRYSLLCAICETEGAFTPSPSISV